MSTLIPEMNSSDTDPCPEASCFEHRVNKVIDGGVVAVIVNVPSDHRTRVGQLRIHHEAIAGLY